MEISNSSILITGASRGIGAACAAAFRSLGARLCLTGRDEAALQRNSTPDDLVLAGEITSADFRKTLIAATLQRFNGLDILINNAGAGLYGAVSTAPLDEVRRLFELNVFAPLALTQLVVPQMRGHGHGCIVNISSLGGQIVLPWLPLYCASKFSLSAWTAALRAELAGSGVHAITVCPGYVDTDFEANAAGPRPPAKLMGSSSKRFSVTPEQCAAAIVRGVQRDANVVVTPRSAWLLLAAQRLWPGLVESALTTAMKNAQSESAA
jgi:short-subunit dehydrogenase